MSTAVKPQVLQSDNGGEFLGKCLAYVKEYFIKSTNMVKGRPRRPRTQGSVERGNAPFKKVLHQWMIKIQQRLVTNWGICGKKEHLFIS